MTDRPKDISSAQDPDNRKIREIIYEAKCVRGDPGDIVQALYVNGFDIVRRRPSQDKEDEK